MGRKRPLRAGRHQVRRTRIHGRRRAGARPRLIATLLCLGSLPLLAGLADAAESYFLGEPWEAGILRGVAAQRSDMRRDVAPDTLVGRAERAARRDGSVVNLYCLARAYGVRAEWNRAQAKAVRDGGAERLRAAEADHASALATYRDLLQRAPRCYFAYHDMGVLELQRKAGDVRQAFQHFGTAYRLNSRFTPTQRQLITLYVQRKQTDVALALLQRLVELEPDDDEARRKLALALAETKQYEAAYAQVEHLVRRDARNPAYLLLRAHLDAETGKLERALSTYKRLVRINRSVPVPFLGMLTVLGRMHEQGVGEHWEDLLFALRGLKRLTQDPERLADLDARIRRAEHAMAAPPGGGDDATPDTGQLLHALDAPDERRRIQALLMLITREEAPTPAVLRAIAGHLDARREPSPGVRAGAVRAIGRLSGSRLAPLLRHALRDADPRVRAEAADTLVGIGRRDPPTAKPLLAMLGAHLDDADPEVETAVRQGVLRLAGATLGHVAEESDEAAHRRAFRTWWEGPEGESAQIDALDRYHRIGDKSPDQVIVPYLSSRSFFVWKAAYEALGRAATTAATPAWRRWYESRLRFADEQLVRARWPTLREAVARWVAARPDA
jgi:tetratricopeptide (TPR) repeat protein